MKIYGIFRGVPGLGRVMSGITLLNTLEKKFGAEIKVYTYMQGLSALKLFGYKNSVELYVTPREITSLGLDPVCKVSAEIINDILDWKPDIVLIDGEPLLTNLLSVCYDKNKIITLLNPSDLKNSALPKSTSIFFSDAFLKGACAIVHGIDCSNIEDYVSNECNVYYINTILRNKIIEMKKEKREKNQISCILGGGSKSPTESFINSTIRMGKNIIKAASIENKFQYNIFCNDEIIFDALIEENKQRNVTIFKEIADVEELYREAALVICRAGRNTTSEVLYLDIPIILMAAGNDYRASEQKSNIGNIIRAYSKGADSFDNEDYNVLANKIREMISNQEFENNFIPGNQKAVDIIIDQYNKNNLK